MPGSEESKLKRYSEGRSSEAKEETLAAFGNGWTVREREELEMKCQCLAWETD